MTRGRMQNRTKDEAKSWRERPISADDINRAQTLEHIFVPQEPIWLDLGGAFLPGSASIVEHPFTQFFVPADDPWPALPYEGTPHQPGLDAAQQEAFALMQERHVRAWGVTLGLARMLIGALGLPALCERRACGRTRACTSDRTREEWANYPGPAWPPCIWNWKRAQFLRPAVERLIDRLDSLIEARLAARLGEPWAAVEAIGLTHLPPEEVHAALVAMFEEREMREKIASSLAEEGA